MQKNNMVVFVLIHFICFEMHMERLDKSLKNLNYINFDYQSLLLIYVMADFPLGISKLRFGTQPSKRQASNEFLEA